jgi:Na+-translocating ferredoxin:NAD+ oxidoreductase RnfA subunit
MFSTGIPPLVMTSYLFLVLGAALVNNVVFVRILGLCPFMGVSKKLETAVGMGLATMFVLTLACGTSYLIDTWLLKPFDLGYLSTLSFIVVIAAIVQVTELVIQKTSPLLHQVLGIYLPLITTNCAVLGVPLLNAASMASRPAAVAAVRLRFGGRLRAAPWCCSPASASGSTAPTFPRRSAATPSP